MELARLRNRATADRYAPERVIGRGGMGVVLSARDLDLERVVALKRLRGDGSEPDDPGSTRALGRFLEEARLTGSLDHPCIVPVHDVGVDGEGNAFFTMKLVHGRTLADVLRRRSPGTEAEWSQTRIVDLLHRVSQAVAFAHSRGVVHRDLKPANLMIGDFGEAYVMDWGIAVAGGHEDGKGAEAEVTGPGPGAVVGTPCYMPPEQARGERVGPLADVYALGAILYEVLAGRRPYEGEAGDLRDLLHRIAQAPPRPDRADRGPRRADRHLRARHGP